VMAKVPYSSSSSSTTTSHTMDGCVEKRVVIFEDSTKLTLIQYTSMYPHTCK
jgi:hypothetical protein